jgi:NB-ARC domain/APAF-1 helical domain
MLDLQGFQEKVKFYRKQKSNPTTGKFYTQADLAQAIGLYPDELGHRLRGTGRSPLTKENIRMIVRTLAAWETLSLQEAEDLLKLMGYSQEEASEEVLTIYPPSQHFKRVENRSANSHCDFYAHINLPLNYVERGALLKTVRNATLRSALQATVFFTVLHGMGGIGKTVIARALCEERKIQAAFPDGILWATLGKNANLIDRMRDWIQVLGGTINGYVPTVESMKEKLTALLKDRACLLILDDVWHHTDIHIFRVGGPRCHLLITTRNEGITREFNPELIPIPIMAKDEALELLSMWVGSQSTNIASEMKRVVAKQVEYLPLALKLAGTQLQRTSVEQWLQNYDIRRLASTQVEECHDSIVQTFTLSLDELDQATRQFYVALAIFQEDEAIPQTAIHHLWSGLNPAIGLSTEEILDDLASRALLEIMPGQRMRTIQLHDLHRDLIILELGRDAQATHQALLRSYKAEWKGQGWHTTTDDGYLYNHLAYHLYEAQEYATLQGLFSDHHWLHVRVSQCGYLYDGYLEDLALAWKVASADALRQTSAQQDVWAFLDWIRYLLIHSSINSIAENHHPELIQQALALGVWESQQALSVATKLSDRQKKLRMYLALLRTNVFKGNDLMLLQRESLDIIFDPLSMIQEDFASLVPYLSHEPLQQALQYTFASVEPLEKEEKLEALAPYLSQELLHQALEHILHTGSFYRHNKRLQAILGEGPKRDFYREVVSLALLAPYLSKELLQQAFQDILAFRDTYEQMGGLTALAPYLSDKQRHRALQAAWTLRKDDDSVRELTVLLTALTPDGGRDHRNQILDQGVNRVLDFHPAHNNAQVLEALLPHLDKVQQNQAVQLAFRAIMAPHARNKRKLLAVIAPHLSNDQLQQVLQCALADDRYKSEELFAILVPYLSQELRQQALQTLLGPHYLFHKLPMLTALTPHLTHEEILQALQLIFASERPSEREKRLEILGPYLSETMIQQALRIILTFSKKREQLSLLAALIPHLPSDLLDDVLQDALVLDEKLSRDWIISKLAPYLSCQQVQQVLSSFHVLEGSRSWTLIKIARHLKAERHIAVFEQIVSLIQSLKKPQEKAELLSGLVSSLPLSAREFALHIALSHANEDEKTSQLAILVPHLPGNLLECVYQTVPVLADPANQVQLLATLLPHLSDEQQKQSLERCLQVTLMLEDAGMRAKIIPLLAAFLEEKQFDGIFQIVLDLPREEWQIKGLLALAPHLPRRLLHKAFQAALAFSSEWNKRELLTALVPYLSSEQVKHAFQAALAFSSEWDQSHLLIALAPRLSPRELKQALSVLTSMNRTEYQAMLLSALAPRLSQRQCAHFVKKVLFSFLEDRGTMMDFERAVADVIFSFSEDLLPYVLQSTVDYPGADGRVEILKALLPRLPDKMLQDIYQAALTFPNEWCRDKEEFAAPEYGWQFTMSKWYQAELLTTLVPLLSGEQHIQVLGHALHIALHDFSEGVQGRLLSKLIPYLMEGERMQRLRQLLVILDSAVDINDFERVEILKRVAPYLSNDLLQAVLQMTEKLEISYLLLEAILHLSPFGLHDASLRAFTTEILLRTLQSMKYQSRDKVLSTICDENFLKLPLFSEDMKASLMPLIFEISKQWRWLP